MKEYFTDLHIHIGRSADGSPVKITAARNLTLANILDECLKRKGIQIIGVVDAGSPKVQADITQLINSGKLTSMEKGGMSYLGKAFLLLGAEVETTEAKGGNAHFICYFPNLEQIGRFTGIISKHIKNVNLSSQKAKLTAQRLFEIVDDLQGIFIPAHAFTPHKGIYGSCAASLREVFTPTARAGIYALELGLSSDSYLADRIAELAGFTFLSNSDAHSLPKIGREYNVLKLEEPNYQELQWALKREKGRSVRANYGLDPRLGKYHRSYCLICDRVMEGVPPVISCEICGGTRIVKGVLDRIEEIADYKERVSPGHRPPYYQQVPLGFIPGVGDKTIEKLLEEFGTEMNILHFVEGDKLSTVIGEEIALRICRARAGKAELQFGGGGRYGKILCITSTGSPTKGKLRWENIDF